MNKKQICGLISMFLGVVFFLLYWKTEKKIFWVISTIFFCLMVIISYLWR